MQRRLLCAFLLSTVAANAQRDLQKPFRDCKVTGSTTLCDYKAKRWTFNASLDATVASLPASTFKIINLLIALETGVIKSENDTVRWVGTIDTSLYGYRPGTYKDMTVREAFQVSAGWVFIGLSKKIGRGRYKQYLSQSGYGNGSLSTGGPDFWNFGTFAVSPLDQSRFLVTVYEGTSPFSKRSTDILKRVMNTETNADFTIRAKTGRTRAEGKDSGW